MHDVEEPREVEIVFTAPDTRTSITRVLYEYHISIS
jgi:hypothetical protein